MRVSEFLGMQLPIIQAPMAGVQKSALALAVSSAGGLGSLPRAMLNAATLKAELSAIKLQTDKPININFFCHTPPLLDRNRESSWRSELKPYYDEFGIDAADVPAASIRQPFSHEVADILEEFQPSIVSFHFGLPATDLFQRVRSWGA